METSPVTATIDNRILLSSNNLSQYNRWTEENCQEDFYADPPNQWVTYSNPNIEITFQVPFNPHWGSSRFRINPYDEYQPYIQFGPYYIGEACAWSRSYYLKPVPRLSIIEAQSRIEHDPDMQLIGSEFEINELKVIKYIESNHIVGGCVSPTFQISGKSFNYILSSECSPNPDKDFNLLEEVLRTVGIRS